MANTVYDYAKSGLFNGGVDLNTDTIKAAMLMSNNTVAAHPEAQHLSDLTLDECDGVGYTRITLTGPTVTTDTVNHRAVFTTTADIVFPLVAAGSRTTTVLLIYKHVGADAVNIPLFAFDTLTGLPVTLNGANLTFLIPAAGIAWQT